MVWKRYYDNKIALIVYLQEMWNERTKWEK